MIWRSALFSLVIGTATLAEATGECVRAPEPSAYPALPGETAVGPIETDRVGRMVAPVRVNGEGPFRFIVDTGANRSALSARLVDRLGLMPEGMGEVHSVYGPAPAPMVDVGSLHYGELPLSAGALPVLEGPVLAREHGLLGVDGMAGRRLTLDFERRCIEIEESEGASRLRGWAALRGELRFGHLVVVEGRIASVRVNVLIDTGSDTSLANLALREALEARLRRSNERVRAATASEPMLLEHAIFLRRLNLGELQVNNVPMFVGDFHIFTLWGLRDEPTILLGMDVLREARALAIDYGRGRVYFRINDRRRSGRARSTRRRRACRRRRA